MDNTFRNRKPKEQEEKKEISKNKERNGDSSGWIMDERVFSRGDTGTPHSMNTTTRKRQASGKEKKNLDTSTPISSMQKDNVLPDGISMTKQEEQGHDINKQHGVIVGTRKRENQATTFKNVKDTKLHTAKIKKMD